VSETRFYNSFFELVEMITANTINVSSKRLLMNYIVEAQDAQLGQRARSAIRRYMQKELPSLDELRLKSKSEELSRLDHLVLKMEYEASRAT
jgi:hypothetical protein